MGRNRIDIIFVCVLFTLRFAFVGSGQKLVQFSSFCFLVLYLCPIESCLTSIGIWDMIYLRFYMTHHDVIHAISTIHHCIAYPLAPFLSTKDMTFTFYQVITISGRIASKRWCRCWLLVTGYHCTLHHATMALRLGNFKVISQLVINSIGLQSHT